MPHSHTFRLIANLVVGLPDRDGWVRTLLIRRCACQPHVIEALWGDENRQTQRNRLTSWEVWTDGRGLHSQSHEFRYKP